MAGSQRKIGAGEWAVVLLGAVLVVFGAPMLGLGLWLIALGGSWYYALAGLGLLATAWFLLRRDAAAFWIYLVTFIGTMPLALRERGFEGWAQVPRLVVPTLIMVLMFFALPVLRQHMARERIAKTAAAGAVGLLVTVGAGLFYIDLSTLQTTAQSGLPAASVQLPV